MRLLILCRRCRRKLPPDGFYTVENSIRKPCKRCRRVKQRIYDGKNRDRIRERQRAYSRRPDVRERIAVRRRGRKRPAYAMTKDSGMRIAVHRLVVLEHRLVLADTEVVHHVDGDVRNNRVWNLWVFRDQAEHQAFERGANIEPIWRGDRCPCRRCAGTKATSPS